jgi:hypothetical protein
MGLNPYATSNGHFLVVECTALLYANSMCSKHSSHSLIFFLIMDHNNVESVLFTTAAHLFEGGMLWKIAPLFQVLPTMSSKSSSGILFHSLKQLS